MKSNKTSHILIEQLRSRLVYAAGAVILLVAIVIVAVSSGSSSANESEVPLFTVKSGPLTIRVSESGRLKNRDEIVLKNETKSSLKIVSLVEEGTVVKKGDLIMALESDALETVRDRQQIDVKRGELDVIACQKRREIMKNQQQAQIDQAEVRLRFARLDLERFTEGTHPKNLEAADAEITMAQAILERAKEDYNWSQKLYDKGFITERTLKADELAAKQRRINFEISETNRDLLVKYTDPQTLEGLESEVKQAEMSLERTKLWAEANLTAQQSELYNYEIKLRNNQKWLTQAQARLDACRIIAPVDGMVIYGTSGSSAGTTKGRELMEVGATVESMHKLIRMPMSDVMLAVISVEEDTKPKLHDNMPAVVTVDALPGQAFKGRLTTIGILPDAAQAWLNPDLKVYECEVELDSQSKEIKLGMSCHVDITIEEHENALFVPIQCVVHVDGKPTVYLKKDGGFEKRVVQTGMDNKVMIHIISGLEDGDQVSLDPPLEDEAENGNTSTPDHSAIKSDEAPKPSQEK